jgi:hypothetical protein
VVAELFNKTVHAVMHIGWVPDGSGSGYHRRADALEEGASRTDQPL